jgi:hypothetical protein
MGTAGSMEVYGTGTYTFFRPRWISLAGSASTIQINRLQSARTRKPGPESRRGMGSAVHRHQQGVVASFFGSTPQVISIKKCSNQFLASRC